MEKALFGLTTNGVRRLVYDFPEKMKIPHRFSHITKMTEKDWQKGLWPFNDEIFPDEDFVSSNLTEEENLNIT